MSSKEMEEVALRGEPLDKSSFSMSFPSIALSVEKSRCSEVVRGFKKFLFHGRKVKPVRHDPAAPSTRRLVLLDPCVMKDSEEEKTELKIADRPPLIVPKRLSEKLEDLVGPQGKNISDYTVKVGFDGMSVDEILRKLLPKSEHHEIPSSFEQCGTLARINIRDELMPYRYVIGQVILEKNKRVRTVVCKKGMIESEFRTLPLEIVAGDNNTIVTTIEHGTKFRFDYRTVYWNSRLGMEHHRIVKEIEKRSTKSKDKVVCDMFCGVGPFAIPAAKQGLEVLANDLNPESVKYLRVNTKLNKVETRVECFNKDGREFVRDLLTEKREFQYVLMNLPAIAIEFLDVFRDGVCDHFEHMPRIYCYCFSKESTVEGRVKDVIKRAEMALNISSKDLKDLSVRDVRDVAPQKMYMCIEFELPRGCKTSSSDGRGRDHEDDEFPKSKRMKVESDDGQ
eukprot:g5494.t1